MGQRSSGTGVVGLLLFALLGCFLQCPIYGKVRVYGELPDKPVFLDALLNQLDLVSDEGKEMPVAKGNGPWVNAIAELVQTCLNATSSEVVPSALSWYWKKLHIYSCPSNQLPIQYWFSRDDAREILLPLLRRTHHDLELDDATIDALFSNQKLRRSMRFDKLDNATRMSADDTKSQVFDAASRLQQIITRRQQQQQVGSSSSSSLVLSVGQTPVYLTEMLRGLEEGRRRAAGATSNAHKIDVIDIPFSGYPDLVHMFGAQSWTWQEHNFLGIITPERERFFRQQLTDRGFSPERFWKSTGSEDIWILDVSRGTSLSCLLLFIARWFQEEGVTLPNITFVEMEVSKEDGIYWYDSSETLDMQMDENIRFEIDVRRLDMDSDTVLFFDNIESDLRIFARYYAILWTPRYDGILSSFPTSNGKKMLQEYHAYGLERELERQNVPGKDCVDVMRA